MQGISRKLKLPLRRPKSPPNPAEYSPNQAGSWLYEVAAAARLRAAALSYTSARVVLGKDFVELGESRQYSFRRPATFGAVRSAPDYFTILRLHDMKKPFCLLLFLAFCGTTLVAAARPARQQVSPKPQQVSATDAELTARSLQLTCYLTDMLRLDGRQAGEVRRATLRELQQQRIHSSPQALAAYDAALLRILNSHQYRTFRWLEDRQPVANLLVNPALVRIAAR